MKYVKISWHSRQLVEEAFVIQTSILGFSVDHKLFSLSSSGLLTARIHYAWDMGTCAWPSENFTKGSCVHDVLCQMVNLGLLPKAIQYLVDEEMRLVNDKGTMWKPRVLWTFLSVRNYMKRKTKWAPRKVYEI